MAGNLISSLSLFTVKFVPPIDPAWWLNTRVNGSNTIISSGNHECFKNKTQWSDCGAESWCRKKIPSSVFTFFSRQAPGQIVTSRTACLGVAGTWWRTACSTEQALKGSLLLAPSGGRDHTFFGNFRCSGEHQHCLIIHGKSHAHTLLQLVQSWVDFYWVVDEEERHFALLCLLGSNRCVPHST